MGTMSFNKKKSEKLSEEFKTCSICLCDFENGETIRFLLCFHRFHKKCIDKWLKRSTKCPICNGDMNELAKMQDNPEKFLLEKNDDPVGIGDLFGGRM
jgi:hypothetical protein